MTGNMVEQLLGDINAEILIVITNAFDIEICIRGYHFFNQIWLPTIGEILNGVHEDNPILLVKDIYDEFVGLVDILKTLSRGVEIPTIYTFTCGND